MKIWECLSERGEIEWSRLYKKLKQKEWELPEKGKRAIQCEIKIEPVEEISKLMMHKPHGRMGR